MTREELTALGLSDEQAQTVTAEFDRLSGLLAAAKQTEVENTELAAQVAALQAQIELRDKREAVLTALPEYKPRDAQIILRLIDLDKITLEEGRISGLAEQLQALKSAAPYLFTDAPDPVGGTAASGLRPDHFDMNTFLRGEN